jgi:transcriptional regulator with PAS, ATPase and Fis domain
VHVFACLFQIRRAFNAVFDYVIGASMAVARLRAAVWESIFTHDLKRYGRTLFATLGTVPTLISGPSGTGKELVARAIAVSRYVPFDPRSKRFESTENVFHPVNISALAPTLVESEVFGHVRGSFTGALRDRKGRLEECGEPGTVFIDEIGEVDPAIQVKLLRVIQERKFQRLGETTDRPFLGKIIAATNRDLAEEMLAGRFREDLYYRLCGDIVTTPSLRQQLDDLPEDLPNLVRFVVVHQLKIAPEAESDVVTDELVSLIHEKLPADYEWPGNFRELEQCVRNLLIHRDYRPLTGPRKGSVQGFIDQVRSGELSAEDLLRRYYSLVYKREGNYRAAAKTLGVDWRTVRDKIDPTLFGDDSS